MDTIRRLIVRMATENREWDDTRIRGARGNLGQQVARGTIANVRKERGLEPAPERKKRTTRRECLAAHWDVLAAADCFTVEVWTPRGLTRFHRAGPDSPGQPLRSDRGHQRRARRAGGPPAHAETPPMPRTDSCDTSGSSSMTATRASGRPCATRSPRPMSPPLRRPARAPNLNAYTERFVRTIKDSCLARMGLIGEGLAASRRPRVRRARPPRTESPGARQSPDPAAVDSTATPWSRPVPPAARWDVARRLSVSSVIHDRPSTPRSSSWTVRPGPNRHQPAPGRATHAAVCARAPAELGTPSSESPLENRGVKLVRLNGYPQREQS